jgi:tetratricopeptide (TPR) repeat protein
MNDDSPAPPRLADLEAAVHRRPAAAETWRNLADAYMAADAFELSIPALEQAIHLAPRDADLRWALANALHQVERYREALPHVREALRLRPLDPAEQAFHTGIALDDVDDPAAAEHLRTALFLDPEHQAAWIRLAFRLLKDGKAADAVPVFERAAELRPGSARIWTGLARAAAKAGLHGTAVRAARAAIAIEPSQPDHHWRLATSLHALGRRDEAAMALAEVVWLCPNPPQALEPSHEAQQVRGFVGEVAALRPGDHSRGDHGKGPST